MRINIQAEIETIMGREMNGAEYKLYRQLRNIGYANPYDIIRKLEAL